MEVVLGQVVQLKEERALNKKRINALLISAVLILTLLSPVFGSETQNEKINLVNFEETILVTDLDIVKAKKSVTLKQYDLKEAQADEDDKVVGSTDIETKKNLGYNVQYATMNVDYERWLLSEIEKSVVLEGKSNYFGYLLKLEEIELQQSKIARLNKELDKINTRIEIGTAVVSEKITKELEISSEEFNLSAMEFDLDSLALDLNKSLIWDLDTTIEVFNMDIPTVSYKVEDLDALIESVLENNGELVKLNEELELAEMDLEFLYEEEYEDEDSEIIDAKSDIKNIELDIRDKKLNLEYDVRSTYNSLLNSKDQMTIRELELENLNYTLEITQKRFDVGLEVIASVESDEEALAYGDLNLKQSRLDYYIAVETFKNMTTFEE